MAKKNNGKDFLFSDDCGFINGDDEAGESYRYSDGSGYFIDSSGSRTSYDADDDTDEDDVDSSGSSLGDALGTIIGAGLVGVMEAVVKVTAEEREREAQREAERREQARINSEKRRA